MESLIKDYLEGASQLRQAVAGLSDEQLRARPIPGKWSVLEVVCHIADFEPVYADRMKRVIATDNPALPGGDPDLFAAKLGYDRRDIHEELNLIEIVRSQMARILRGLSAEEWQRTGMHSESGPLSVEQLLRRIVGHVPHHVKFIEEKRQAMAGAGK